MSKKRSRRQNPRIRHQAKTQPARVHLASGVRLEKAEEHDVLVLVSRNGKVPLNEAAVTILRLCDGSRTRDGIVAAVTHHPRVTSQATDVGEFLDVARSRGWIVEA